MGGEEKKKRKKRAVLMAGTCAKGKRGEKKRKKKMPSNSDYYCVIENLLGFRKEKGASASFGEERRGRQGKPGGIKKGDYRMKEWPPPKIRCRGGGKRRKGRRVRPIRMAIGKKRKEKGEIIGTEKTQGQRDFAINSLREEGGGGKERKRNGRTRIQSTGEKKGEINCRSAIIEEAKP